MCSAALCVIWGAIASSNCNNLYDFCLLVHEPMSCFQSICLLDFLPVLDPKQIALPVLVFLRHFYECCATSLLTCSNSLLRGAAAHNAVIKAQLGLGVTTSLGKLLTARSPVSRKRISSF